VWLLLLLCSSVVDAAAVAAAAVLLGICEVHATTATAHCHYYWWCCGCVHALTAVQIPVDLCRDRFDLCAKLLLNTEQVVTVFIRDEIDS
jgi:hypothetical protein